MATSESLVIGITIIFISVLNITTIAIVIFSEQTDLVPFFSESLFGDSGPPFIMNLLCARLFM